MTEPCPHCGAAVPHGRGHCPSCLRAVPLTNPASVTATAASPSVLPWLIAAVLAITVVFLLALLVARDRRQSVATSSPTTTTQPALPPPSISPQPPPPPTSPPSTTIPPSTTTPPTTPPGATTPPSSVPPSTSTTTVPEDEPATRYDPDRSSRQALNAAPVGPPTRLWRSMFPSPDFETAVAFHEQPTENVMVVNAVSGLFVLDPEDGAILWQTSSFDTDFRVVDVGEDDVVVASAVEAWVVDREQGEEQWRVPLGVTSDVFATEDSVVVWDSDLVEVFDRSTGEARWDATGVGEVGAATDGTDLLLRVGSQLQLFDRVAVEEWSVPTDATVDSWLLDAHVVAITQGPGSLSLDVRNREDGALLWARDLAATTEVRISSDDVIVLGTSPRTGLDVATGEELWTAETGVDAGPTIDDHDGLSVERRGEGEIVVRRVADGGIAWPQTVSGLRETAVGDRIVMALAGQDVIGFDMVTGSELWRVQPEIVDASVISAIENGFVVANSTGEVEGWRLAGGGDAESKV